MNTILDRRAFLKGLLGAAVVVAVAPALLAHPTPEKAPVAAPAFGIDVGTGTIFTTNGVDLVPGDRVTISYSSIDKAEGIYEVKAVHVNGGEVTIAVVHNGDEVTMDRDEVIPYLNRQVKSHAGDEDDVIDAVYPNRSERRAQRACKPPPRRAAYTWPQPRRRAA